ncbi:hypothetical protein PGTUg99_015858 [Puccinia graminis f. sp. tritici]|uniref:Uncharacterized protein n=1 Tax=Puccinia graminis f. sp. tritici TaxID=56615 RepID=A0A5B0S7Z4_PUCGR|nr:hypothetical protein PGTUg99_015858 [Puccinia graminis f. sp. tritici]
MAEPNRATEAAKCSGCPLSNQRSNDYGAETELPPVVSHPAESEPPDAVQGDDRREF